MSTGSSTATQITRIDAWACRHPVERPVATSFGVMRDRPAVFVRIEDEAGCFGWGEVFANWPAAGAEHRVNLLFMDVAELVFGLTFSSPPELFQALEEGTRIRALQCGEWGPFRQVTAGLDMAAWDLFARRADLPLRRLLTPEAGDRVPAYASGIAIRDAGSMIPDAQAWGFRRFKVKVGFALEQDAVALNSLAGGLGQAEQLLTDANQAWNLDEARSFLQRVEGSGVGWLEEPMPVFAPQQEWIDLAGGTGIPLAGGENLAGSAEFDQAIQAGALTVIQPDVAKWGGVTGCLAVARNALAAGRRYCPHFLGAGIGLAASAELLAAAGGDGMLEVDVNPNPLRDAFGAVVERVEGGHWELNDAPGLGVEDLPESVIDCRTLTGSCRSGQRPRMRLR
jgi:L-alanine-DL-glutamate epimerase-like enolase superfamily enzyme